MIYKYIKCFVNCEYFDCWLFCTLQTTRMQGTLTWYVAMKWKLNNILDNLQVSEKVSTNQCMSCHDSCSPKKKWPGGDESYMIKSGNQAYTWSPTGCRSMRKCWGQQVCTSWYQQYLCCTFCWMVSEVKCIQSVSPEARGALKPVYNTI